LEGCCETISPIYSLTVSDNPACHFRPGAWRLGFNSGFVTLKIFSSRKDFSGFALAMDGQVVHLSVFDRPK